MSQPQATSAPPSGCPMSTEFDPFGATYLADPYAVFSELREKGRVVYSTKYNAYLVSHYDDVVEVMKNRDVFSSSNTTTPVIPLCPEAQSIVDKGYPRAPTFTNADPPRHTKIRSAAMLTLTPRRWKKSQPEIAEYAEALIQDIAKRPVFDAMADLTFPLPAFAAFRLIGYPLEDIEIIKNWCAGRVRVTYGLITPEEQVEAAHALVDFWDYCRKFVALRQKQPEDDLASDWLALVDESKEDSLQVEDVVNMVYAVSLAAHETSTNAMLNGIKVLMENREIWDELCQDPSLINNAVEELLRFNSPTVVLRRLCKEDYQLKDVTIPKGATVMLLTASTNRDGERFENPDKIDIRRPDANKHLAFGHGWHFCMGAPLARYEFNLVLNLLVKYLPNMSLVTDQEFSYVPSLLLRGVESVLINTNAA